MVMNNFKNFLVLAGCLWIIAIIHNRPSTPTLNRLPALEMPAETMSLKGNKEIIIAVVDTGVDFEHYDFRNTVFEKGYNFVNNNTDVTDLDGHGTHVTSIITRINKTAHIMPIKFYSKGATHNTDNLVRAFQFAVNNHADIINFSGGGHYATDEEFAVMKLAEERGILVVAAAGNGNQNIDVSSNRFYPASYRLSNMLVVGNVDHSYVRAPSSNYGLNTVNVFAVGQYVYSALPGNKNGYKSGTSQATAKISGLASLFLAKNPKFKPQTIIQIIEDQSEKIGALSNLCKSGGVADYPVLNSVDFAR